MNTKIQRALLSVWDKTGLVDLARALHEMGVELVSSGNTSAALEAAARIHSDIARGFIRAEVVSYADFFELRSDLKVKEAGKLRLEGRDYVMEDGDIIHIRFKV